MELHQMIAQLALTALTALDAKDKLLAVAAQDHDLVNEMLAVAALDAKDKLLAVAAQEVEGLNSANHALQCEKAALIKDRNFVMDQLAENRAQFKHLAERYEIKARDLEAAEITIRNQIEENSDLQDANEKLKARMSVPDSDEEFDWGAASKETKSDILRRTDEPCYVLRGLDPLTGLTVYWQANMGWRPELNTAKLFTRRNAMDSAAGDFPVEVVTNVIAINLNEMKEKN